LNSLIWALNDSADALGTHVVSTAYGFQRSRLHAHLKLTYFADEVNFVKTVCFPLMSVDETTTNGRSGWLLLLADSRFTCKDMIRFIKTRHIKLSRYD